MESEVDNTAKTVSQRKRLFLAHCPKVEMFRFQPKFFLEMFRWSRRMPIWGICSFRASQSFHGLTTKRYDVVSLSKKFFQKFPLVTNILIWTHLSKTFAQKPGIFSPQNQQTESNFCFFSKKNLLSKRVPLDTWNAVFKTPLKLFCHETGNFSVIAQMS